MAGFDGHINQSKKNFKTLSLINKSAPESWDWQVTISYYVAVHIVNAHLAQCADLHYKTHESVKNALFKDTSIAKIPEEIYTSYVKLEGLSRRARYLCHENSGDNIENTHFTYDKHLKRALKYLDKVLDYFKSKYGIEFDIIDIDCIELKNESLKYFQYKSSAAA